MEAVQNKIKDKRLYFLLGEKAIVEYKKNGIKSCVKKGFIKNEFDNIAMIDYSFLSDGNIDAYKKEYKILTGFSKTGKYGRLSACTIPECDWIQAKKIFLEPNKIHGMTVGTLRVLSSMNIHTIEDLYKRKRVPKVGTVVEKIKFPFGFFMSEIVYKQRAENEIREWFVSVGEKWFPELHTKYKKNKRWR